MIVRPTLLDTKREVLRRVRGTGLAPSILGCARLAGRSWGYVNSASTGRPEWLLDTAPKIGILQVADLNNLDEDIGTSTSPVNTVDGVRWNSAFAYLE